MTIEALRANGLILFEVVAGSHAYGLATKDSDMDIKGVFYLPKVDFYSGEYIAQVADEKNDVVYYELGRFFELLSKSNPSALEILATPIDCVRYKHPLMEDLNIRDCLSLEAVKTFSNYAMVQVQKAKGLNKKINNPIARDRKTLLDFCYILEGNDAKPFVQWLENKGWDQTNCGLAKLSHCKGTYGLYHDSTNGKYKGVLAKPDSCDVSCSSIPKGEKLEAYLVVNQDSFAQHCKNYKEYFDWESNRNEKRFLANLNHNTGYDAKNMMHTIRLKEVAKDILLHKDLRVKRSNREELLKIKSGLYTYEELLDKAVTLQDEINELSITSELKETLNIELLRSILVEIRTILYN